MSGLILAIACATQAQPPEVIPKVNEIALKRLDGSAMESIAGKPLLVVNVASKCGFTPQYDDLQKLEKRTLRLTDNPQLRTDLPEYRSVAGLVKEDHGNLVPLILVVGHHKESDPAKNKYKMLIMDVTFDAPKKGDMTYAGGERPTEIGRAHV